MIIWQSSYISIAFNTIDGGLEDGIISICRKDYFIWFHLVNFARKVGLDIRWSVNDFPV